MVINKVDNSSDRETGSPGFDQQLAVRFVAGDKDAFMYVFEQLKGPVFIQVRRLFGRPFDQDEAFQECWLQVHRRRSRFDVNRHQELPAWIRRVARTRCLDLLKARGRSRELPVEQLEVPSEPSQHRSLVHSRARQALDEFVARLEPDQQRHFELCFVRQLSHEEVARELSISVRRSKYLRKKTVASMLRSPSLRRVTP